nr:TlpA family protein disulfide reductase [Campylobacter sp.]
MKFKHIIIANLIFFIFLDCSNETSEISQSSELQATYDNPFTLRLNDASQIYMQKSTQGFDISRNDKAIVFIFFTTWCPPCLVQMNYLSQFYLNYQDDFKIVGILMEDKTKEQIDEFVAKNNIQFKIAYGENNFYFANAVGYIDSMPYILILNAEGKLIQYYSGLIPPEMLESDIKRALL